jgi:hypothetical protein
MMLLERRGISGAIEDDDGTVDLIETVSSAVLELELLLLLLLCDVKIAGKNKFANKFTKLQSLTCENSLEAFPIPMLTFANTENSDDDKLAGGDCSPSLVENVDFPPIGNVLLLLIDELLLL